jgi:hypothetical protein
MDGIVELDPHGDLEAGYAAMNLFDLEKARTRGILQAG